jgi:hypothetical protein
MRENTIEKNLYWIIIIIASILNIIADIILFYDNDVSNKQVSMSLLKNTEIQLIHIAVVAGYFTIPFWLLVLKCLNKIPLNAISNTLIQFSYTAFILGAFSYHRNHLYNDFFNSL